MIKFKNNMLINHNYKKIRVNVQNTNITIE